MGSSNEDDCDGLLRAKGTQELGGGVRGTGHQVKTLSGELAAIKVAGKSITGGAKYCGRFANRSHRDRWLRAEHKLDGLVIDINLNHRASLRLPPAAATENGLEGHGDRTHTSPGGWRRDGSDPGAPEGEILKGGTHARTLRRQTV